ncbi:MAG: Asp-tRNA(Asn)/Glu-tRNA(Gln) amidotransferase subunit GatC, partial [Janthinobacterium lividum]
MAVDTATVARVARLARIATSDEEAARLAPELDNIMGWIEQLAEVDTAGVE